MDGNAMNDVQTALLGMLVDFDRAMREEGAEYFLAYGSALGAVRHKGFIPWDDDVDIFILRDEVPKFERAFERMDSKYILQRPFILDWPDAFYKIKLDGSYAEEPSYPNSRLNHGLWIDIFILDRYPDSKPRRFIHNIFSNIAHLSDMATGKCIGRPILDPVQKLLILNIRFMHRLMNLIQDNEDCELYLNRCVEWDYTRSAVFRKGHIDMPMEGKGPFMMPAEWDMMLTDYFGDYMTPPPEDERVAGHIIKFIPRDGEGDE